MRAALYWRPSEFSRRARVSACLAWNIEGFLTCQLFACPYLPAISFVHLHHSQKANSDKSICGSGSGVQNKTGLQSRNQKTYLPRNTVSSAITINISSNGSGMAAALFEWHFGYPSVIFQPLLGLQRGRTEEKHYDQGPYV